VKYFTPELWASWQDPGYKQPPPESDPFALYQAELEALRHRLEPGAFGFFSEADVHDGELIEFRVIDGSRPAPLGEPAREWSVRSDHPVGVSLQVLDAWDKLVWTLQYKEVRRVVVNYSTEEYFLPGGSGFGDWGYHELTDPGGGFLRHEVLFSSGSTLLVEFRTVEISSRQARAPETLGQEGHNEQAG
jgi:hypothetical protein